MELNSIVRNELLYQNVSYSVQIKYTYNENHMSKWVRTGTHLQNTGLILYSIASYITD